MTSQPGGGKIGALSEMDDFWGHIYKDSEVRDFGPNIFKPNNPTI